MVPPVTSFPVPGADQRETVAAARTQRILTSEGRGPWYPVVPLPATPSHQGAGGTGVSEGMCAGEGPGLAKAGETMTPTHIRLPPWLPWPCWHPCPGPGE